MFRDSLAGIIAYLCLAVKGLMFVSEAADVMIRGDFQDYQVQYHPVSGSIRNGY